jgi:adenosylcobinamide kinase/adenosylcobinamide-phosphate guanylyltransferase
MGKLILITGGARSGKSALAEQMAVDAGEPVLYIATATPCDDEMKDRIIRHRQRRPSHWETYEGYKDLEEVFKHKNYPTIILDCVTVMIANLLFSAADKDITAMSAAEVEKLEDLVRYQIKKFLDEMGRHDTTVIMVTNEVGSGIVPENRLARVFRDIAGRMNQMIASRASEVYWVVCGLPQKIKGA